MAGSFDSIPPEKKFTLGCLGFLLLAVVGSAIVTSEPAKTEFTPEELAAQRADWEREVQESREPKAPPSQAPADSQWESQYDDYYVTCYVTKGIRWYSMINRTDLNDARINQTPDDETWMQVCGRR